MQNNAGPMACPCCTPLEQSILRLSPESIWKNTVADLSPQHLATNGVSAGTQVAASASTAVRLTVLKALEQSVRISQFFFLVVHPGAQFYLLHPPSYSAPKLPRFAVDLLQPPLPHGPGCKEASPRHSYADGATFFAQDSEVGSQEELPELRREGTGIVDNSPPEGLNTSAELLAPNASPDD